MAQNAYHNQISDKYEIQGSDDYGKAIKLSVRQIEYEIDALVKLALLNIKRSFKSQHVSESQIGIQPEDSISNVGLGYHPALAQYVVQPEALAVRKQRLQRKRQLSNPKQKLYAICISLKYRVYKKNRQI